MNILNKVHALPLETQKVIEQICVLITTHQEMIQNNK